MKFKKVTPYSMGNEDEMHREYYPTFSIPVSALPEAKTWKVGAKYPIALQVKQVALREERGDARVEFEVHGAAAMGGEEKKTESVVSLNSPKNGMSTSDGHLM